MTEGECIRLGSEVVTWLRDRELHGPDAVAVLAFALGIYMEAEGPNLDYQKFEPVTELVVKAARLAFDAMRAAREREPGHA